MSESTVEILENIKSPIGCVEVKDREHKKIKSGRQVDKIDIDDIMSISRFGKGIGDMTSEYSDSVLGDASSTELGDLAPKLVEIVSFTKGLDPTSIKARLANTPLARFLPSIVMTKDMMVSKFQNVKTLIDTMVDEVELTRGRLDDKGAMLNNMQGSIMDESVFIREHLEEIELSKKSCSERIVTLRESEDMDHNVANQIGKYEAVLNMLDHKRDSLERMLIVNDGLLASCQISQANCLNLIDQLTNVNSIVIPSWKKQFMLYLALDEQNKANQLAKNINDTTNDLLSKNAEQLRVNSIDVAKNRQTPIIQHKVLLKIQDSMIDTIKQVKKIDAEGQESRDKVKKSIQDMSKKMISAIVDERQIDAK